MNKIIETIKLWLPIGIFSETKSCVEIPEWMRKEIAENIYKGLHEKNYLKEDTMNSKKKPAAKKKTAKVTKKAK